jgi:hypothetical protein
MNNMKVYRFLSIVILVLIIPSGCIISERDDCEDSVEKGDFTNPCEMYIISRSYIGYDNLFSDINLLQCIQKEIKLKACRENTSRYIPGGIR